MKLFTAVWASAFAIAAASAAHADPINYTNFTGATGLTYGGGGMNTGSSVTLTSVGSTYSAGAVYANNALASPQDFSTTFSFNIAAESNGNAGNGFAFVLSTTPQGMGLMNQNFGLGNPTAVPNSLDIQFATYANPTNNPKDGSNNYYSNMVAVSTDGNLVVPQGATSTYGAPYSVTECNNQLNTKSSRAGCLANGDIWTASVKYQNGLLTVSLTDPKEGTSYTVINNLAINLSTVFGGAPVFAGFSASNGAASETVQLDSWLLTSVPEPASLALMGVSLAGLGFVRSRRRAA